MGTSLQKSFCWSSSWKENRLKSDFLKCRCGIHFVETKMECTKKHFSVLSRLLAGFSFSWWSHTLHHKENKVAGKSQRRTLGLIYRIPFWLWNGSIYSVSTAHANSRWQIPLGWWQKYLCCLVWNYISQFWYKNILQIYCRFPRNPFTIDKVDQWPDHLWQPWKDSPHRAPGTNLQKRQITKPSTSDQYYGGVGMLISAALYVIVVY